VTGPRPPLPAPEPSAPGVRVEVVVDLAAVRHDVRRLRAVVGPDVAMMTVVKADGYGHGMLPVARAAREAGAGWLGVATVEEALALRQGGDQGPVLCWLTTPGQVYDEAVAAGIDLTAYTLGEVADVAAAARRTGTTARLQLKVDTGLSRGGARPEDWPALVAAARVAEEEGALRVTGIWSHPAAGDEPGHPANDAQERVFREAIAVAERAGLRPEVRHLANSAAAVLRPSARFDLVRCGIACYGQDPAPGHTPPGLGLVPAMTVQGRLAMTKRLAAGESVSYGHTWTAARDTTVGLVPAGYADGVPRHASSPVGDDRTAPWAEVWVAGRRRRVLGRVCMDQFVVDLGGEELPAGEPVELIGTGHDGAPTAQDWAVACGTINYEIVTRMGGTAARLSRRYVDTGWDTGPNTGLGTGPDTEEDQ
jgi:alanine racemase